MFIIARNSFMRILYLYGLFFVSFSFCCSIAIGSPAFEAEYLVSSKIKGQTGLFTIDEILSPKKYLRKYLEIAKQEALREKSPDSEHQQLVVENKTPSNAGENDNQPAASPTEEAITSVAGEQSLAGEEKGTQTPTAKNASPQTVPGQESSAPPSVVAEKGIHEDTPVVEGSPSDVTEEKISADIQKTDVSSIPTMPGSATTFAQEQQFPAVDESVGQTRLEDSKLRPPLAGEESLFPSFVDKKSYLGKYLNGERHQPGTPFSETLQETPGVSTPGAMATPELQSETIVGGEPPPTGAMGIQTPEAEDKSHPSTDESKSTFTPAEDASSATTKGSPDVLILEAKEPEKRISLPGPPAETEDLKPTWDIWHKDPTHNVILAVAIALIAAKIGGWITRTVKVSEVVGNLVIGIILGNIFAFTGWDFFHFLKTMPFLKMISYFGTLILLFTVGLHVDLRALLQVGTSSLLVCMGGIIAPAGLGLMVGHFFLPDTLFGTKLILAIILCNTATGLKLVVLKELKAINSPEGRVITGATVLTDIVVFLTFGVVSGFAVGGGVSFIGMSVSFGIAIASLIISGIIILRYSEKFGNFLTRRMTEGANIPIVVVLSLLLAFMFGSIGLHTIMGAFVAGLFLRNVKVRSFDDGEHRNIELFIRPFYMILVPILFVRVGAQVDLKSFLNIESLPLILAITSAAVLGKMFCSVCPIEKGINRLAIGLAMVMKMDGTLIVSGIAKDMGMLNDAVFSSIIVVIVLTSTIFPSLLKASLIRHKKRLSKNFNVTVDEKTKEIFLRFESKAQK